MPNQWATSLIVVSIALSAVLVWLTLRTAHREIRVRPAFEVTRILVGGVALVAMGAVTGVQTPWWLAGFAAVAGVGVGLAQGFRLDVTLRNGELFARRTTSAVAIWVVGLIGMQLAGLLSQSGVFRVGQAIGVFGIAVVAGVMLGRSQPARRARLGVPIAIVPVVMLALLTLPGTADRALGQQVTVDDVISSGGDGNLDELACQLLPEELPPIDEFYNPNADARMCIGQVDASSPEWALVYRLANPQSADRWYSDQLSVPIGSGVAAEELDLGEQGNVLQYADRADVNGQRGRFAFQVTGPDAQRMITLAELIDENIVEQLEREATGDGTGAAGSSSGTGAGSDDEGGRSGDGRTTEDAEQAGDDDAPGVITGVDAPNDDPLDWLTAGEITSDEALASAIAAAIAAVAFGGADARGGAADDRGAAGGGAG